MTSARLIRRDILESERVAKLPDSGKWLFVAILLVADDLGLFEATVHRLHKASDLKHDIVAGLLDRMVELDLVRLYPGPGARTFGFIPRYGQRLQIKRVKHPLPPPALYADDEDAVSKFKHLAPESTVQHGNPPRSTAIHGNPPPEPEPEPEGKEIGTGSLRSPVPVAGAVAPSDLEAGKTRIKRKADPDKPWLK
ncbi:hypothetical protein UFOVP703_1, partial [uncultured Caudovirales phage]